MIFLRPATMEDAELLYRYRTDSVTRAMFLTDGPSSRDAHDQWLAMALRIDTAPCLYIAERGGVPVGTGRFDRQANGEAWVSITIAPECRGKGYAEPLLTALAEEARRHGCVALRATIKSENLPSLRAFLAAGFRPVGERVEMVRELLP